MIIDPITGLPLDYSAAPGMFDAMGQNVGTSIASMYGADPATNGTLFSMLEHFPTLKQTMGWNMWRGSNTLMKGGFAARRKHGAIYNHLHPRSFTRFSSINTVTGAGGYYSPFQAARVADAATRFAVGRSEASSIANMRNAGLMSGSYDPSINWWNNPNKGQFFSPGGLSHLNTMARLSRMNGKNKSQIGRQNRRIQSVLNNVDRVNPGLRAIPGALTDAGTASAYLSSTMAGRFNSYIGGYAAGALGNVTDPEMFAHIASNNTAWASGHLRAANILADAGLTVSGRSVTHSSGAQGMRAVFAGVKENPGAAKVLGARAGLKALPFLGPISAAWTAYDLSRMALTSMTGAMELAKDAMVSFRGTIDKPVFGMGYKDNSVAATSRARGVMAIQNSRLNARSVLGNEGSYLAAHFG